MTATNIVTGGPPGRPAAVTADLERLSASLDNVIPAKTPSNLLIATWNIRAFSGVTQKWDSGPSDSPKRDWHAVACIAEVVSRFDVVAVQEARRDTTGLRMMLDFLGPSYRAVCSDVTEGDPGDGERLCFVYDADRVLASGLVGEIVLPAAVSEPVVQFARTPYVASFSRASVEFILATAHIIWGTRALPGLARSPSSPDGCEAGSTAPKTGTATCSCSATSTSTGSEIRSSRPSCRPGSGLRANSRACRALSSTMTRPATSTTRSRGSPTRPEHPCLCR
jgi:hypothetical protein